MTFNGSMPGPMMVVHEGDYVELTLVNPEHQHDAAQHRLPCRDRRAGGGALTLINPGEQVVLRFKATATGVFVYHCAPGGPMIPWHVVSGMNGTIMVLPRDGLKDGNGKPLRYDRIYYVGENDFYVPRDENGNFKTYDIAGEAYADTLEVMRKLIPTHVVFNGRVGALTGENALTANVGETVLIVHSQANRDTRPHLIGGHGDYVWETGQVRQPAGDRISRPGSSAAVRPAAALYTFLQPGIYAYVNHNLIEAVELGATAHFKVEGKWNDDLMKQVKAPEPIPPVKQGALQPQYPTRTELHAAASRRPLRIHGGDMSITLATKIAARRRFREPAGDAPWLAGKMAMAGDPRIARTWSSRAAGTVGYRAAGEFTRAGRPVMAPLRCVALDAAAGDHDASGQRRRLSALRRRRRLSAAGGGMAARARPSGRAGELARCRGLRRLAVADDRRDASACRPTRNGPMRRAAAFATMRSRSMPTTRRAARSPATSRSANCAIRLTTAQRGRSAASVPMSTASSTSPAMSGSGPRPACAHRRSTIPARWSAQRANCGVRVVEGRHRAYVTDFVRDARGGGCAAGVPPTYLGFRLVREGPSWRSWAAASWEAWRAE